MRYHIGIEDNQVSKVIRQVINCEDPEFAPFTKAALDLRI